MHAGLPLWARQVVFDEADLLLAGAYEKPLRVIMDVSHPPLLLGCSAHSISMAGDIPHLSIFV